MNSRREVDEGLAHIGTMLLKDQPSIKEVAKVFIVGEWGVGRGRGRANRATN